MKTLIAVAILAAVCAGCNTSTVAPQNDTRPVSADGQVLNRIPGTDPIEIPQGVSDVQALDVVESVIR